MARTAPPPISVSRRGSARGVADCTVVWLRGEHDMATKVPLVMTLARAARLDGAPLLVDLSAVTFMDASTVGALLATRALLRSRGQTLEVRSPSSCARRVLQLCGVAELIREEADRSAAAAAMTAAPALATWVDVPAEPADVGAVRPDGAVPADAREVQRAGP